MIKFFGIIAIVFTMICKPVFSQAQIQTITYEVTAKNLSLEAVDSYPQKLIHSRYEDSLYRITASTFAAYDDTVKRQIAENDRYIRDKVYPEDIKKYLEPTPLTDYNIAEIERVADSVLRLKDSLTVQVIDRSLKYASQRIKYDNELAVELDNGKCTTLDVETILERGKGTCSEYTNLFIALMRKIGIPCRMAVGWVYLPDQNFEGSHAWAECYISNYGWLAVDPQNGFMWFPPIVIKLFHGKDFIDCNIKTLPDMCPVKAEVLK